MSGGVGIGIDIGGTKVLLVAVDRADTVLGEARVNSPDQVEGLLDVLLPAITDLVDAVGCEDFGFGLALPGLVGRDGLLTSAPNLGAAETALDVPATICDPIVAALADRGARAAAPENDATMAALAEARIGAARGRDDVLVVSIGTGIGGGLVAAGQLVRGAHGYAGEIGHMIVDAQGPRCTCGQTGCWEAIASGRALAEIARARATSGPLAKLAAAGTLRGEDVVEAARHDDATARAVIDEFAGNIALGLVNAIEILDPDVIVLGGGLITASDVVLGPTRRAFERRVRPAHRRSGEDLVPAELGSRAAAIGMALLARDA